MRRFFVPPETLRGDVVPLDAELLKHLRTVLRLRPGDDVLLLDGHGTLCRCRLESFDRAAGLARVVERQQVADSALPLRLIQGLPKGDKLELVLQKGTELGVTTFAPVTAGRSVPDLSAARSAQRQQRWERIVREAARQSGRNCLPVLEPVGSLAAALDATREELRLLLWEEGSRPLAAALPPAPPQSGVALLIGPEGGFSAAEARQAEAAGFVPVRCGPRILRTETAGLALVSILQFLYGDLGSGPVPRGVSGKEKR